MNPDILILPSIASNGYVAWLKQAVAWHQPSFHFSGKEVKMPRLVAWYGDVDYRYSGLLHTANPMPSLLKELGDDLAEQASLALGKDVVVNSALLNWYRDGADSISFHSDDERELGKHPVIISVSFGVTRQFVLKHKHNGRLKKVYSLMDGNVVVMYGKTQEEWLHGIPKEPNVTGERFNITFRMTY